MKLTLLHTNDIHGHFDELARLVTMARRIRAEVESEGGHCLLIDCGDAEDRTVLEVAVTRGNAAMAYLRAAGYDLAAVGNGAALSFGPQVIPAMAEAAGFPFMAANLLDESGNLTTGCTASVIREIGGIRLGFIGMAPRWHFWRLFGIETPESAPIVIEEIEKLRADGAQQIVLLSHLGLAADLQMILSIRDIALILGGHSHTTIFNGLIQFDTLIAQAGDYGRFLGRVDLHMDDATGEILSRSATLIPLDPAIDPNPAVMARIATQKAHVAQLLQQPVGQLSEALSFDPIEESRATNLLADAIRERTGANVAICFPANLLDSIDRGTVILGDVYRACKSPANPTWRILTGSQLLEMLEVACDPKRAERIPFWTRGRPHGLIAVSGMTARFDPAAPPGTRVTSVTVGDEPLVPDRHYRVSGGAAEMTNLGWQDQRRRHELSFELNDEDANYEVPTTLRDALEEYLRKHTPVTSPETGRIGRENRP
ncbi:MAG: bifunctional UDP-sugar hydrolase/5'-nucleotidase [Chloroflexota bacterium]|nr:bifunctional UDP-sugar hydrolase/5'-nucleotidase [Chloroflexota bacterium]